MIRDNPAVQIASGVKLEMAYGQHTVIQACPSMADVYRADRIINLETGVVLKDRWGSVGLPRKYAR